jgi:hypothetical protein
VPSGREEARGPLSTRSHVELLGRVLYHGLLRVEPMMVVFESLLLGERLRLPKQSMMNSRLPK